MAAASPPSFGTLGLDAWMVKQCSAVGMSTPTEIQRKAIPLILKGKNVVGSAETGSGKTAAFALPIIQQLSDNMFGVFALVFTPSRELAYQLLDQFIALGSSLSIRASLVIGGMGHTNQLSTLLTRPHIVIATPGRMRFLLENFPETHNALRNVRFLVLDEVDRLTTDSLLEDVSWLCDSVREINKRVNLMQTLVFSATISEELKSIGDDKNSSSSSRSVLQMIGLTTQPEVVECSNAATAVANLSSVSNSNNEDAKQNVATTPTTTTTTQVTLPEQLQQRFLFVAHQVKLHYLVLLLRSDNAMPSIIFTNSCLRCEVVRLTLQLLGFPVTSLNSLLSQPQRVKHLSLFKSGVCRFLVATDIAARGLDIPSVGRVIQYDFPKEASTYVHRVGRTARAGSGGLTVSLMTEGDFFMLKRTEKRLGIKIKRFVGKEVDEEHVLKYLDEVSNAKVDAKLQVKRQFGEKKEIRMNDRAPVYYEGQKDEEEAEEQEQEPQVQAKQKTSLRAHEQRPRAAHNKKRQLESEAVVTGEAPQEDVHDLAPVASTTAKKRRKANDVTKRVR